MSAPTTTVTAWQWPADVLAYAAEHQLEPYLEPLLEVIRQIFPDPHRLSVYVDQDPELRDVRTILFDVQVMDWDLPQIRAARTRWTQGIFRVCPAPVVCHFGLLLDVVRP